MHSITNGIITIKAINKGAELQSIFHEELKLEYLWSGDPNYWAKKSPVLFPIVGGLKDNSYKYNGKEYQLGRHGFARDNDFELAQQTGSSLIFSLKSIEQTKRIYPFDFLFLVKYALEENKLHVSFTVENPGNENLLFSVGAHPAFAVPIAEGTSYEDYYLQFNEVENAGRWPLSNTGLIENAPTPFLQNQNKLQLKKELFYKDAIVFKNLQSTSISIVSDKTPRGVKVSYPGFPYMGIWAAKDANFVCIEPWCGIADSVNTSGNLEDKEGIHNLKTKEQFKRTYTIEVF